MDINNMTYEDYMNLYYFIQVQNKVRFKYANFIPTEDDIEKYNKAVDRFKEVWDKDRSIVEIPVIFKDVKRDDYYIEKLNKAHKFEIFVENAFKECGIDIGFYKDKQNQYKGETKIGLEIKNDMRLKETGNIFIEFRQRLNNNMSWLPSGILKQDNTKWWIIGNENEYYIIHKQDLIKQYNLIKDKQPYKIKTEVQNGGTGQGFILSREEARKIMITNNIAEFVVKVGLIE